MLKDRADEFFKDAARESILELKLDLTACIVKGRESPLALEALEGASVERHLDGPAGLVMVSS